MSAAPPLSPIGTASPAPAATIGESWLAGSWHAQLQPGSWRGVGFVMDATPTKAGRRVAVHEYPYRDTVWPEDLGKLPRHYQVAAFLVGDDCYQQKQAMIAACEKAGPGTLVHPILGSLQVVLLDFSTTDRRDRGRYVEVELEFIDAGTNAILPATTAATGQLVANAAKALNATSATSLAQNLATLAAPVPTAPTAFIQNFATLAVHAVNDPSRALSAVSGLVGFYGRYAMGRMTTLQPETTTVAQALANADTSRQGVITAANALVKAGNAL
jgi:prophage DNA circulation protein